MEHRHWTHEELLGRLYGVDGREPDLPECSECRRRWEDYRLRREQLRSLSPEIPESFLAVQRAAIEARLRRPSPFASQKLATSAALILLVLVALTVLSPGPSPEPPKIASEDRLFEEVFSLVASPEPQAVQPVRSLFEEKQ